MVYGLASTQSTPPSGLGDNHLARAENLIANLRAHRADIESNAVILARPGDDFIVTDTLGLPSQWEVPRLGQHGLQRILWLIDHFPMDMLDRSEIVLSFEEGTATVLISQEGLVSHLRRADPSEVSALEAHNFHLYKVTRKESVLGAFSHLPPGDVR